METIIQTTFFSDQQIACLECKKQLVGHFGGVVLDVDRFTNTAEGIMSVLAWADKFKVGELPPNFFLDPELIPIVRVERGNNWVCWPCFEERIEKLRAIVKEAGLCP